MRKAFPISWGETRSSSSSPEAMSRSISSSIASSSLKPLLSKNLMPLYSIGLCEALTITPACARMLCAMKAMPGVGSGPTSMASTPIEQIPATSADSRT